MAPGDGARRDATARGRTGRDGVDDALAALRRELGAARAWATDDTGPGPGAARTLTQVTGDLTDTVAAATRAGRGQEARLLLAGAAAGPVHPARRRAWTRLLETALAVADAVTWPEGEPWGRLPRAVARRSSRDAQSPGGSPV